MDQAGIEYALISISSPGLNFLATPERSLLARAVNEEGAEAVCRYPDRLGLMASLPLPDVEAAARELAHAQDVLGAKGVVLMTNYDGIYLGDPRLSAIFEELDRRAVIVAVHPTSPAGGASTGLGRPRPLIEFPFDTTRAMCNLILGGTLIRCPALRVIVPHLGGALPFLADRIRGFTAAFPAALEDGPVDVDAAISRLYFDSAGEPLPHTLPMLLQIANPAHVLYGSDMPFAPPGVVHQTLGLLRESPLLGDEFRMRLLGDSARSLFSA